MDEERPVRKPLRGGRGAGVPMADDGGLFGVVSVHGDKGTYLK